MPLSVVRLFGVIYAIKTAARDGVAQPSVWTTAGLGAALLAALLHRQTTLEEPLLDLRLFRKPAFSGAISANVVTMFASSVLSLGFALYFQVVRGWSPLTAGLAVLPGPLAAAAIAPVAAALVPLIGRARTVAAGLFLMGVSTAGLGMATPHTAYWQLLPVVVINGAGLMLTFAVTRTRSWPARRAPGRAPPRPSRRPRWNWAARSASRSWGRCSARTTAATSRHRPV